MTPLSRALQKIPTISCLTILLLVPSRALTQVSGEGSLKREQSPISAADYLKRGTARAEAGDVEAALSDFTKAIELDEATLLVDQSAETKHRLLETYNSRGILRLEGKRNLDLAITDFTSAITLNPRHPVAYRQRALARQLKNDPEGATADSLKAAEIIFGMKKKLRPATDALADLTKPSIPAGVVAQVNATDITRLMVRQRVERAARLLASQKGITERQAEAEVSKHQAELVAEMIKEQFIEQQVQRLKMSSEIQQRFNKAISRAANERKLTGGQSPDALRAELRAQITKDLVFIRVVGWKVYFNPSLNEVKSYFASHPERFRGQAFNAKIIRAQMKAEWRNAELLNEMSRTSSINLAETYREAVTKQLTEPIQLAADIPRGEPARRKGWGQLVGEFVFGCGVVPMLSRGELAIGPCGQEAMTRRSEAASGNHFHKGVVLFAEGDFNGAIKQYSKAISNNPHDAYTYLNRGSARAAKGDLKKAIADFTSAIEIEPSLAPAYARRGLARLQLGLDTEAEQDFAQALDLDHTLKIEIDEGARRISQQRDNQY